jgi:hypothetical protein
MIILAGFFLLLLSEENIYKFVEKIFKEKSDIFKDVYVVFLSNATRTVI